MVRLSAVLVGLCAVGAIFGAPYLNQFEEPLQPSFTGVVAVPVQPISEGGEILGSPGSFIHATSTSASTTAYVTLAGSTSGTVVTLGSVYPSSIVSGSRGLLLSCNEDTCTANAESIKKAREMLYRIAERSLTINIVADQNCTPKRETIQPRAPDMIAQAQ